MGAIAADIEAAGGEAAYQELDVVSQADNDQIAHLAYERFGRLDVTFLNAGPMPNSVFASRLRLRLLVRCQASTRRSISRICRLTRSSCAAKIWPEMTAALLASGIVHYEDFAGFTMYLSEAEDGSWLTGLEARAFFETAADKGLVVSLSIMPHQARAAALLADAFPTLRILLHHFAFVGPRSASTPNAMEVVLSIARCRNVFIKFSGMGNVAAPEHDYPYADLAYIPRRMLEVFGADRVIWGSDYPVSRKHMTYRQTIRLVERYAGLSEAQRELVLGGNLRRLLSSPAQIS